VIAYRHKDKICTFPFYPDIGN